MKKVFLPLFSFLLVLGLLGTSFGSVKAEIGDDPVVTAVSGDMDFTTEVVSIASLPGTTELESLMLVPVGFPLGEAQFEGNGVHVMDLDGGKATACFAVSGTQYGWGGKVGVWTGVKWMLLPTTITKGLEDLNSLACTTISGEGVYAFIKYVVDPSLLPTLSECTLDLYPEFWSFNSGEDYFFTVRFGIAPPEGTPVKYQVIAHSPAGSVSGPMNGVDNHLDLGVYADFTTLNVVGEFESAKLYIELPTCFKVLEYTSSTPSFGGDA